MKIRVFVEGPIDANNYVIIDEETKEAILIDCSSDRPEFIEAIKSENIKIKYILLTHGHFDHILGVDTFKDIFNADAYVSEDDMFQVGLADQMMQMFAGIEPKQIKSISHYVKDGDEFKIGNITIKAIATPGHTKGGMCYLVDNKLFTGDTLFKTSIGRCDLPGGSLKEIVDSLKNKLFELPNNTEVYSGHGEPTTIEYEKKYNEILNI